MRAPSRQTTKEDDLMKALASLLSIILAAGMARAGWTELEDIPTAVYEGGGCAYGEFPLGTDAETVYAQCGASPWVSNAFYAYFVHSDQWDPLAGLPYGINSTNGGALCFAPAPNGYHSVFSLCGDNDLCYFRHNSDDGSWVDIEKPLARSAGCAICYGGTGSREPSTPVAYLYAFKGGSNDEFWRYYFDTPSTLRGVLASGWAQMEDFVSNTNHAALTYRPYDDIVVWGLGGTYCNFEGYLPGTDEWTTEAPDPWNSMNAGVTLAAHGYSFTSFSNYIYATKGGAVDFKVYAVNVNTWSSQTDAPWSPGAGAGLTCDFQNEKLYCLRGGGTTDFASFTPDDTKEGGGQGVVGDSKDADRVVCVMTGGAARLSCVRARGLPTRFRVFDQSGRELWSATTTTGEATWTTNAPSGCYNITAAAAGLNAYGRVAIAK